MALSIILGPEYTYVQYINCGGLTQGHTINVGYPAGTFSKEKDQFLYKHTFRLTL